MLHRIRTTSDTQIIAGTAVLALPLTWAYGAHVTVTISRIVLAALQMIGLA